MHPENLKYAKSHEWAKVTGNRVKVGITAFAIEQLTDLTYLELKVQAGETIAKGKDFATVESVKSTSDIYAPVSGKIVAVNNPLTNKIEALMKDPYEIGWMIEIEMSNSKEIKSLMTSKAYEELIASGH